MANETTTTTVTELVNSEWIRPVINHAAKAKAVVARYALQLDLRGKATSTAALPQEVSDVGTPANYDATEGTDLSNIAFETTEATVSSQEYGILRRVTDDAVEDNIMGMGLYGYIVDSGAEDMAIVLDDDAGSLLDAFATTVGATTVDLSLANLAQAMISLRNNEMPAPGGAVYVLGQAQAGDYETALLASTGTQLARYAVKGPEDNGLNGSLGTWMNAEVWVSSLTDTANAAADITGALFLRGDEGRNPRSAALAVVTSREIRPEIERSAKGRGADVVITQRKGVAEAIDLSGVSITTDA